MRNLSNFALIRSQITQMAEGKLCQLAKYIQINSSQQNIEIISIKIFYLGKRILHVNYIFTIDHII
jgi:DNA-binding TFAR19-related protein (PDSD5 family)